MNDTQKWFFGEKLASNSARIHEYLQNCDYFCDEKKHDFCNYTKHQCDTDFIAYRTVVYILNELD